MASPERQNTCGECKHFSLNTVNGEPFGEVTENGEKVSLGVCRTNCGLMFGEKKPTDPCLQPVGFFEPSERKLDELPQEFEDRGIEITSAES